MKCELCFGRSGVVLGDAGEGAVVVDAKVEVDICIGGN